MIHPALHPVHIKNRWGRLGQSGQPAVIGFALPQLFKSELGQLGQIVRSCAMPSDELPQTRCNCSKPYGMGARRGFPAALPHGGMRVAAGVPLQNGFTVSMRFMEKRSRPMR